jgi:hypothetical protein
VRSKVQCVPATLVPRQRRRRFPERELLARIRHYEAVLQQHQINFEPLHPPAPGATPENLNIEESPETLVDGGSPDTRAEASVAASSVAQGQTVKSRAKYGCTTALAMSSFSLVD